MRYSYTKALQTIIEWAKNEGFDNISFNYEGISEIGWEGLNGPKAIKIEDKYPVESKAYLMLHELGHYQLRKDWDKFKKTLPITAYAEHIDLLRSVDKYKRRVTYSVSCVEEEFKAWDEGLKLANRLGIKINMAKWNELKSSCLISYIRYYGTK